MMPTIKQKESPKPSLLVTVELNSKQLDYLPFILASSTEFRGVHLEDKIKTKKLHLLTVFFESLSDGKEFFDMLSNTDIKVYKEDQ